MTGTDQTSPPPGAATDDGWSTPSLWTGRSRVIEPRLAGGYDPMSTGLLPGWDDEPGAGVPPEPVWSTTTYVGPRRRRPNARPAAETIAAQAPAPARGGDTADGLSPAEAVPPETAVGAEVDDAPAAVGAEERSTKGLLANSRAMAVASLTSRVTGFLRTSLLVAALGTAHVGDAYNLGNNFPNMVYELLLGGVLSSVLIPLLVRSQERDDDEGVGYAQRLLSLATVALGALTVLAVVCAPLITTPFVDQPDERTLATTFAYLLLPEIFFYGIGAMLMAVLNIRHSYAPGAWSPVLNNVVMLVTLAVFWALPGPNSLTPASITTAQVLVLGIGTSLGIAAQALVLVPALRKVDFHWKWRFRAAPHEAGRMREVGALAGWVLGYVVASQIGVIVIGVVGGHHRGAFTVFTNADLMLQMPYGILVVSLLTALMPRLSRAAARGETGAVVDDLGLGARLSAVALLPVTAGLIALGAPLGITLFAHGQTSLAGGSLIGTALAASAFGLLPFAVVMLQLRVFYAMHDGRTPTLINVFMVGTKVTIVLVADALVHSDAHLAEALTVGTSASYVVGALVGHLALRRRFGALGFGAVARTGATMAGASLAGGLAAYGVLRLCTAAFGEGHLGAATGLVLGAAVGLAVLGVLVWRLRVAEVRDLVALARR